MDYKTWSPWIFIAFILLLAMMWASGSSLLIGFGIILAPILIIFQAYIILRSKEKSDEKFEDKWYENK